MPWPPQTSHMRSPVGGICVPDNSSVTSF
jgi:hypothetical protein